MAIGVLLTLQMADSIEQAEKKVKEIRPEVEIHPEFIKDLKRLFPNK
ncbi:hypothetical protein [Halalkalibacterium ligniniphilum]|nr:hypothetical protein [Halalkalibacterium ligniniphilum]